MKQQIRVAITGGIGSGGDFLKNLDIYIEIYRYDNTNLHADRPKH
jgi:hypothetical protein